MRSTELPGRYQAGKYLTIRVTYLLDHIHQFSLSGVLSKRSHDGSELLGGDGAYRECEGLKIKTG